MSTTTPAPKAMSSRLLTMKFMQRAAASTPTKSTPATPEQPSAKRRKVDKEDGNPPPRFNVDALADQRAIQAAIASEEAKRLAALERQADESGDTRWVLSFEEQEKISARVRGEKPLRVVEMGWGGIDSKGNSQTQREEEEDDDDDEEDSAPVVVGRRSFGKFNKVVEKQRDSSESEGSEDEEADEESDNSEADSDDPTAQLIKAERSAAVSRIKAERLATKNKERRAHKNQVRQRVKKEVNLNGLSSLSGRQDVRPDISCYSCGGPHRRSECPNEGRRDGKRRYEGDHNSNRQKAQRSR